MPDFKVGDTIEVNRDDADCDSGSTTFSKGTRAVITAVNRERIHINWITGPRVGYGDWHINKENWHNLSIVSISSPSLVMSVCEFFKNKLRSADEKTLIKAGFKDNCGILTSDGQAALIYILADLHQADLVKAATDMLAEQESDKKCKTC